MAAAIALGERGRGLSTPNPNVGCVIVKDGIVVGRGWTQRGGRPHAEAMALAEAGAAAAGATAYVTLEPCAHASARGPACAELLVAAQPARVAIALADPDPRTDGAGIARLEAAGIAVEIGEMADQAARSMAGFLTRIRLGRPFVTLKLALSIDGRIALPSGESQWITGEEAAGARPSRAGAQRHDPGRARTDLRTSLPPPPPPPSPSPRLDVRLPGSRIARRAGRC